MDHYKTLGVSRTATQEEIQQAYHALALKYHPDTNPGDAAAGKIKEINKAYQVLRRENTRKAYDETLPGGGPGGKRPATPPPGPSPRKTPPPGPFYPPDGTRKARDVIEAIMPGIPRYPDGPPRSSENGAAKSGNVPTAVIELTAREGVTGATKTILVNGKRLDIKIIIKP